MAAIENHDATTTECEEGTSKPHHAASCGTMEASVEDAALVGDRVKTAIQCGYRAFDLAEHYESSKGGHVGAALAEAMAASVQREELWITHKIDGMPVGEYEDVKARVEKMIELAGGIGYIDALLIHYPAPQGTDLSGDPSALCTPERWTWFTENIEEAWTNMSRLRADGLVKHAGVSNFYQQHLEAMDAFVGQGDLAPIYANEVWIDAAHPSTELVEHCQAKSILVYAYRSLVFMPMIAFLDDGAELDTLTRLAVEEGLDSPHQLVLYALARRGCVPVTGASSEEHMRDNLLAAEKGLGMGKLGVQWPGLLEAKREMCDMMGCLDEYADAFSKMGLDV